MTDHGYLVDVTDPYGYEVPPDEEEQQTIQVTSTPEAEIIHDSNNDDDDHFRRSMLQRHMTVGELQEPDYCCSCCSKKCMLTVASIIGILTASVNVIFTTRKAINTDKFGIWMVLVVLP